MALTVTYTINDIDELALKNDLLDIQAWVDGAIKGKIANCKKRMNREWVKKLQDDPTVDSIPGSEDALIAFVVARSDYKNRASRKD